MPGEGRRSPGDEWVGCPPAGLMGGGAQCQDSKQVSRNQLECSEERAGKAGVCGDGEGG